MIHVECVIHTRTDKYTKEKWPTKMAARPLIGDLVKSESCDKVLRVTSIIHATLIVPDKESCWGGYKEISGLKVHLGL